MTREELMINDIVFDYTNSPVKVCAVGQDIVVKKGFGVGALDPNELSPIPLTEDILVKNGWDFTKSDYSVYCKEDTNGDVELSKDKYGFYWSINCDEYIILRIDYVHQLQHLLRLCGIEKEIEL